MTILIDNLLNSKSYDVRIHKDARFVDQKCTPDVVCFIADCIMNLRELSPDLEFTVQDIWDSDYFIKNVKFIFNKPSAKDITTKHEYDKFIQQPLKLLSYSGVLFVEKRGNINFFKINDLAVLEYISLKDRNSYSFLYKYFIKVLSDSGVLKFFEEYKNKYELGILEQNDFEALRSRFVKFIIGNTPINKETEIRRIFPKILNIYACENTLPGSERGKMSKHEFYYTDLMYNRINWRDIGKEKNVSRRTFADDTITEVLPDSPYNVYLVQKAMNQIRKMYKESEVKDQWANGEATQVHHIFPKSKFPEIAHFLENLIKLTPTQHYTKAHPNNKTDCINLDYQLTCLLAKADSIEKSIKQNEFYYKKENFIYCINMGLKMNLSLELSFREIKMKLVNIYNNY